MKLRTFNGVDIGDSAVEFFDKLAKFESNGKYDCVDKENASYIGRYQLGTDALADMGWVVSNSGWSKV